MAQAQQNPVKTVETGSADTPEGAHESEADASEAPVDYTQLLKEYTPETREGRDTPDVLHGRYTIQTNAPLPELDIKGARAYRVKEAGPGGKELYATVCDSGLPLRISMIRQCIDQPVPQMVQVFDAGAVKLSSLGEYRYVIVMEKPSGRKLSEIMPQLSKHDISDRFMMEGVMKPLAGIIAQLEAFHGCHGRINLDTIYYDDTRERRLMLGEAVSCPPGYSQDYFFETLDRSLCDPLGKGGGDAMADCYAIGVVALQLLLGENTLARLSEKEYRTMRLQMGSYNALLGHHELPEKYEDLLRGLLNDKKHERWTSVQMVQWLDGKRFNLIRPSAPREAPRPYTFKTHEFMNRKQVAEGLYENWKDAALMLRDPKFIRWIELSVLKPEVADALREVDKEKRTGKSSAKWSTDDMIVAQSIMVLDMTGPMRLKYVSTMPDGVGAMMAEAVRLDHKDKVQALVKIIETDLAGYWAEQHTVELPKPLSAVVWKLQQLRKYLRLPAFGFGLERCLYELNPTLPCQSPMIASDAVLTLEDLLYVFDSKAKELAGEKEPMDRHIAAFIAARIELPRPVVMTELQVFPQLKDHPRLQMLVLFMRAQKRAGDRKLKGLSYWMAEMLGEVIDEFNSESLKKQLRKKLSQVAGRGRLEAIHAIFANAGMAQEDYKGYATALHTYRKNRARMNYLEDWQRVAKRADDRGTRFALISAYLLCILSLYMVLKQHFSLFI